YVHHQIEKAGIARWHPKLNHLDGCGQHRTDGDGRGERQPPVSAAAEREVPRQTGGDVDDEIDGDIAEQEASDVRGPGMEKNPDWAMRQGSRREMPRIEASVGNQRK